MSDIVQDIVHVGDWVSVTYNESLLYDFQEPYKSLQTWEGRVIEIEDDRFWIEQPGKTKFVSRVLKDSDIHRYYITDRFRSTSSNTNHI